MYCLPNTSTTQPQWVATCHTVLHMAKWVQISSIWIIIAIVVAICTLFEFFLYKRNELQSVICLQETVIQLWEEEGHVTYANAFQLK